MIVPPYGTYPLQRITCSCGQHLKCAGDVQFIGNLGASVLHIQNDFRRKAHLGLWLCILLHLPAHQMWREFRQFMSKICGMCVMYTSHLASSCLCLYTWLSFIEGVRTVICISGTLWTENCPSPIHSSLEDLIAHEGYRLQVLLHVNCYH